MFTPTELHDFQIADDKCPTGNHHGQTEGLHEGRSLLNGQIARLPNYEFARHRDAESTLWTKPEAILSKREELKCHWE